MIGPFFIMKRKVPFTLHIRLTKACNAECTYCSAWQEDPRKVMTLSECEKSINFIVSLWEKLNLEVEFLCIEYVGGEVLLLPTEDIVSIVNKNREIFSKEKIHVHDGVQTNLIANHHKIKALYELFEGRVGTSIDDFTNQRRLSGSSEKYQVIMMTNEKRIQDKYNNRPIPGVFVIDPKSYPFAREQVKKSLRELRNIVLRPVFNGGIDIELVTPDMVEKVMVNALEDWVLRSPIIIEPLYGLLKNRLQHKHGFELNQNMSFCSFMSDCASRSLSLEPNGDLYICQELADHEYGKLGNAIKGEFDFELWSKFNDRPNKLHKDCLSCPYLNECRGGCMMQSIEQNLGMYGKSVYCSAWKGIFSKIDEIIDAHGTVKIMKWIDKIEEYQKRVKP